MTGSGSSGSTSTANSSAPTSTNAFGTSTTGGNPAAGTTAAPTTSHRAHARDHSGKKPTYHCDYCRDDITNEIYIKCAECKSFDLCLDCFASGAAVYPHLPTHPYRVIRLISEPLYDAEWSADEELLLLEGIDQFGLGNWAEIALHVGSKNKLKCEAHYNERYLMSPVAPLPNNAAPFPSLEATGFGYGSGPRSRARAPRDPLDIERDKEREISNAKYRALQQHHKTLLRNSIGSLVGFSSHRREFEVEYENDAELLIADLAFKQSDLPWERDLKIRVLQLYNSKLDQRDARREFLISRGLLMKRQRKRTRDEKAVYAKLRPFARFLSQGEFEEFVQGTIAELRLRRRIEQLQTYRMNGIHTFAEGLAFDLDSKRSAVERAVAGYTSVHDGEGETQQGGGKRQRVQSVVLTPSVESTEQPITTTTTSTSTTSATTSTAATNSTPSIPSDIPTTDITTTEGAVDVPVGAALDKAKARLTVPGILPSLSATTQRSVVASFASEFHTMEGVSLLSVAERELCQELLLAPQHYLVVKERIVREAIKHGACSQGRAKQLLRVDVTSSGKIVDFFVSHGWITTEPNLADEIMKTEQQQR